MAAPSAAINPRVRRAPDGSLAKIEIECAGSNTWKTGELGIFDANGQGDPAASGETPAFIYLEDQTTATTQGDRKWVQLLEVGTELEMFVRNDTTDAAETDAKIGTAYDGVVASNIHYLNVNDTSTGIFVVIAHGSDTETARNTTTMTPGIVRVRLKTVQV